MWVEPELLRSGGDVALSAGRRVLGGAEALSAAPIGPTIFGDFEAAQSFHLRLSAHRTSRVHAMRSSHRTLTDVGEKAQTASGWFSDTERENAEEVSHVADA
jgi:hypothetical protein